MNKCCMLFKLLEMLNTRVLERNNFRTADIYVGCYILEQPTTTIL